MGGALVEPMCVAVVRGKVGVRGGGAWGTMAADGVALFDLRLFLRGEYRAAVEGGAVLDPVDEWVNRSVPSVLALFGDGDEVFEVRGPSGRVLLLYGANLTAAEAVRGYKRRRSVEAGEEVRS